MLVFRSIRIIAFQFESIEAELSPLCVFPTSPENVSNGSDCSSSTTCSEWLSLLWATIRQSIGGHFTLTSECCLGLPRGRVGPVQHTNDLALSFLVRTWALDVRTITSSPTHTLALLCENTSFVYPHFLRVYEVHTWVFDSRTLRPSLSSFSISPCVWMTVD